MTLKDYINAHKEELFDFPEEPTEEEFCGCRFVADSSWYGFREETYFDEEAYEDAIADWEDECERILSEYEVSDDLYLFIGDDLLEDNAELAAYLDREVTKADGLEVWVA